MSLGHVTINCAREKCYAVITVHEQEEDRLRKTGETFFCPAGHSNYFPKTPSAEERELRGVRSKLSQMRNVAWAFFVGVKTCPLGCGYQSRRFIQGDIDQWRGYDVHRYLDRVGGDMAQHLQREHGAQLKVVKQIPLRTGDAL